MFPASKHDTHSSPEDESSSWCSLIIHTNNKSMTLINHAPWCSQCQNMIPINQISFPLHRWGSYQSVTDTKWRGEGALVRHPFLWGGGMQWWVILFWERGTPCVPKGRGTYQSVTGTKGRGSQGGGPWWVTLSKEGMGDRDESSKGGTREEAWLHQPQPRGGGWRCQR